MWAPWGGRNAVRLIHVALGDREPFRWLCTAPGGPHDAVSWLSHAAMAPVRGSEASSGG